MERGELGSRLKVAIRHVGYSHAEAQKVLEEAGVRGASHGNFYKILQGQTSPSTEFLAETCRVLGVSADWLLFGQGNIDRGEPVSHELLEQCGIEDLPEPVQDDLFQAALRLLAATDRSGLGIEDTDKRLVALVRGIAGWLRLPLHSDKVRELDSEMDLIAYCDAALRALQMLVPAGSDEPTPGGIDETLEEIAAFERSLAS